ncbi:uncharacterized protein LOC144704646 [Wolffia australiana]
MNTSSEFGFREVERGPGRKTKTMRSARPRPSDDSDWSIGWLEPHTPDFFADAEPPEPDPESSFAVLVPCYARPPGDHATDLSPNLLPDGNLCVEYLLSALTQS